MSDSPKDRLLDAALAHVAFDGWSDVTFNAAIAEAGMDMTVAKGICPRGAVDLAVAYHQRGDALMLERFEQMDTDAMRYSEKVAALLRCRFEIIEDKEAVRRGTTLFALPPFAADGARLVWGTCDAIWNALGDTSDDVNWYTKRATLGAVYSSTVVYWLGDDSEDHAETSAFIDRRIDNVMQFEKLKADVRKSPALSRLLAGPNWLLGQIKAPNRDAGAGLPGRWR